MAVAYTNNASTTLSATITNSATSLSVAAGAGALFPSTASGDYFYITLTDSALNVEIMKVTARSTDTFTVVRGQDGTSGRAWSSGDKVELRLTKAMLDDLKGERVAAPSGTSILKANSGSATLANAVAGTDYLAPPSGTSILKANSGGALANASAGTDYLAPPSGTALLKANSGGALANATANTDYLAPALGNTAVSQAKTVTFNSQVATSGSSTQTYTIDFSTAQKQKLTVTGTVTATIAFSFPAVGTYQLMYLPASTVTTTWPTIGASWQWLNATAAPTLNTGTYGGIVTIYYDGTLAVASYAKIGAA